MVPLFLCVLEEVVEQKRDAGQALHGTDHQLVQTLPTALLHDEI